MENRIIKFRHICKDAMGVQFILFKELSDFLNEGMNKHGRIQEIIAINQFTGLFDNSGNEIFEGDVIEFWAIYPTTQTHTGDNIPRGSYTEPDEPVFEKVKGEIFYNNETGCFEFSTVGKTPYQFNSFFEGGWANGEPLPFGRIEYTLDYLRYYVGFYAENADNSDYLEWIKDITGMADVDFVKVANSMEVIGNIYEPHPEIIGNLITEPEKSL